MGQSKREAINNLSQSMNQPLEQRDEENRTHLGSGVPNYRIQTQAWSTYGGPPSADDLSINDQNILWCILWYMTHNVSLWKSLFLSSSGLCPLRSINNSHKHSYMLIMGFDMSRLFSVPDFSFLSCLSICETSVHVESFKHLFFFCQYLLASFALSLGFIAALDVL